MDSSPRSALSGLVLSVDTATEIMAVALLRDGQVRDRRRVDQSLGSQARELLPLLTDLLAGEGATLADVRGWVVSRGPGSFTGIRIGLASVRALAWASRTPVFGGCTLDALAFAAPVPPGALALALLDARKAEVYAAAYRRTPEGLEALGAPCLVKPDAVGRLLPDDGAPVVVFGRGARRYAEAVAAALAGRAASVLDEAFDLPDAGALALSVAALVRQGDADEDPFDPIYLRKPEAEEKWEAAHAAPPAPPSPR